MSLGIPGSPVARSVSISAGDSASVDAFGRWRVSEPQTLFDSKLIFNDPDILDTAENHPLFYDNQEISGGGTSTAYNANQASQTLSVSANTAGRRARQTKMRFNYQPGKSQLVLMTFNMSGRVDKGITNALRLGSTIAGVVDTMVLCVRPVGGSSNTDIEGSITWREIV